MPAYKFQRICQDLNQIGDIVTISCAKDCVRFTTSGDLGSGNIKLQQTTNSDDPNEAVIIQMNEAICLSFTLKYLIHFGKATPLASQVKLMLAPDVPLIVEYSITGGDDKTKVGRIRYYVAKINEETKS